MIIEEMTMTDFEAFVTWMTANLSGYAKYVEAGSVAAGFARILPIPYAGQASLLTKFVSQGVLSLNAASVAIARYLDTSQKFVVRVQDKNHPSTRDIPATFEWADECYYSDHLNPGIHTLLVTDPAKLDDPQKATYPGDRFGDSLPLAWYQEFDGGREFYTALGHQKEDYANPILYKHILGGILWTMGQK